MAGVGGAVGPPGTCVWVLIVALGSHLPLGEGVRWEGAVRMGRRETWWDRVRDRRADVLQRAMASGAPRACRTESIALGDPPEKLCHGRAAFPCPQPWCFPSCCHSLVLLASAEHPGSGCAL